VLNTKIPPDLRSDGIFSTPPGFPGFVTAVDLVGSYSNRPDLLKQLANASEALGQARALEAVGIPERVSVRSAAPPDTAWRVTDRMDDEAIAELVRSFQEDGTPKRLLAERYGISESSVKRILRKHRSAPTA
jgi:hypothetical protein